MRLGLNRRVLPLALAAVAALVVATLALAGAAVLILPTHTPGARYAKVTQGTIGKTICVKGWTDTIRPPSSYTSALKQAQLIKWNYANKSPKAYEEDHLISLELGGAPRSTRNLWPQPWKQARTDDNGIEANLHFKVCHGIVTLRQAQTAEVAYKHKHG